MTPTPEKIHALIAKLRGIPGDFNTMDGYHREAADALSSLLERGPAIPEGWVLVPKEPTPEMMEVYARHQCAELGLDPDEQVTEDWPRWYPMCQGWDRLYRAMLSAAPPPPALAVAEPEWVGEARYRLEQAAIRFRQYAPKEPVTGLLPSGWSAGISDIEAALRLLPQSQGRDGGEG